VSFAHQEGAGGAPLKIFQTKAAAEVTQRWMKTHARDVRLHARFGLGQISGADFAERHPHIDEVIIPKSRRRT
jgi:hypothetical protein